MLCLDGIMQEIVASYRTSCDRRVSFRIGIGLGNVVLGVCVYMFPINRYRVWCVLVILDTRVDTIESLNVDQHTRLAKSNLTIAFFGYRV